MGLRTGWAALVIGVVCLGFVGCSEPERGSKSDPVVVELKALDAVAGSVEADVAEGGEQLTALGEQLEVQLSDADVTVLVRNYLAMLEAVSSNATWAPDEAFYALVERLRELPLLDGMPERGEGKGDVATEASGLGVVTAPLVLSNISPRCGMSCDAQALTYALIDLTLGNLEAYYTGLLASGVDCLQEAYGLGKCVANDTCTWGQFVLFAGDCAAFTGSAVLELSGGKKALGAYALAKLAIGLWSSGSLGVQAQTWANDCRAFQSTGCLNALCAEGQMVCLAVNGTASACCPSGESCVACGACASPCGEGCCTLGQRCDGGVCTACVSGCGSTCCGAQEYCADPVSGTCAACDNPCGATCCWGESTCMEATGTCCDAPCGTTCCEDGEACVGSPPSCCAQPCGTACCGGGQVCDPATERCQTPAGCEDGVVINCQEVCEEAINQAINQCNARGGVLEDIDVAGCLASCQCMLTAIPNLGACFERPQCPGCEDLQSVVEGCGQAQAICRVGE